MLSALLVALREGVEAALVVGIVLVYLNRTGRRALVPDVWGGVILASAASIAAAILLQRWSISEDGFEGLLMLVASGLVVTMIIWMNRVARHLKREIEQRVEAYARQSTRAAGWGIGAFVFLMVVREGAELVLILRAVELSSAGVQVWIGTALGIAVAVCRGAFLLPGHAADSSPPVLFRDNHHPDGRGFSIGVDGPARVERSNLDLVQQDGNGHHRPDCTQRSFLFRRDFGRCRAGGSARMVSCPKARRRRTD